MVIMGFYYGIKHSRSLRGTLGGFYMLDNRVVEIYTFFHFLYRVFRGISLDGEKM